MPTYDYHCPSNGAYLEVMHGIHEHVRTWGELCALLQYPPGETSVDAPVEKVITAPNLAFPKSNTELRDMGFTKLVRRDKGVYENVTAQGHESRVMDARDPNSAPNFSKTITD